LEKISQDLSKQLSGIHKSVLSLVCRNFQCVSMQVWMPRNFQHLNGVI